LSEPPRIDADLVRRLVAAQFPQWADLPIEPVAIQGWNNKAFHLGRDLLVRLPRAQPYVAQVEKEQTWLPRLAQGLALPIPAPAALGRPGDEYPWPWSIYLWIEGETVAAAQPADMTGLARDLAAFLMRLQALDATDGPAAGPHSFWRGGPLATYDAQTREAIAALDGRFDAAACSARWDEALASAWTRPPVWVHGDVAAGNLLVRDGRLSAVIDFGSLSVGDPACDLAIAWTVFEGEARAAFRAALPLDPDTWARGRGWTLWKALILVTGISRGHPRDVTDAARVLGEVLAG
jgi:aminoglycoside phosphotransferase (APT) family kinase protein